MHDDDTSTFNELGISFNRKKKKKPGPAPETPATSTVSCPECHKSDVLAIGIVDGSFSAYCFRCSRRFGGPAWRESTAPNEYVSCTTTPAVTVAQYTSQFDVLMAILAELRQLRWDLKQK